MCLQKQSHTRLTFSLFEKGCKGGCDTLRWKVVVVAKRD